MSKYFEYLPFRISLLVSVYIYIFKMVMLWHHRPISLQNGLVMMSAVWQLVKWSCFDVSSQASCKMVLLLWHHQPISLQIKKYTEIQKWYFKWLILKICGRFGKSKMLSWFSMTQTSYCVGLTKFKIWLDSSPNITLKMML